MKDTLTLEAIVDAPDCITESVALPAGESVDLRALRPDDASLLGRFFLGLSQDTRQRFAPHPFTVEQAEGLCAEINYEDTIRMIAVTEKDGCPEMIAYFILIPRFSEEYRRRYLDRGTPLSLQTDSGIAPCVADAYQDRGVGSILMPRVVDVARRLGRRRMVLIGGVLAANERAFHFYKKLGFKYVGTFWTDVENYDMILELA